MSPFQSNSLRGQGEEQQLKSNVLPGLPDGKEGHCFLVVALHPGHVKSLTPDGKEGHCFLVVALHPGHVKSLTGMVT